MVLQLVIYFASFQSCQSHNQLSHNSPPSQQHLASVMPCLGQTVCVSEIVLHVTDAATRLL